MATVACTAPAAATPAARAARAARVAAVAEAGSAWGPAAAAAAAAIDAAPRRSNNLGGVGGGIPATSELMAQRSSLRAVAPAPPRQAYDGPAPDSVAYALQQGLQAIKLANGDEDDTVGGNGDMTRQWTP